MVLFLLIVASIGAAAAVWFWWKSRRRARLLASPLTDRQRAILTTEVPLTRRLPAALRANLEGRIALFRDQIDFIGCDGLEITEEMELSIAAQACLLVVNSDAWYTHLRTVLVYPGAFRSREVLHNGYVATEVETVRLGESWPRGPVVLSWRDARQGATDEQDGRNLVLHEFAHQLDDLSGHTDATPLLSEGQSFSEWESAFLAAFERHVEDVRDGKRTMIDSYGAEGIEEFFAVAIELFFERPAALREDEPDVYLQLSVLLNVDPIRW